MATTIRLTVITGPHRGRRYCFRGRTQCVAGRAGDCFVQFSKTMRDCAISRHHCQFDVAVPFIRVTDLGSKNGTYINGKRIMPEELSGQNTKLDCSTSILTNGDILTIGGTSLKIEVVDCPPPQEAKEVDPPIWKEDEIAKNNCTILC